MSQYEYSMTLHYFSSLKTLIFYSFIEQAKSTHMHSIFITFFTYPYNYSTARSNYIAQARYFECNPLGECNHESVATILRSIHNSSSLCTQPCTDQLKFFSYNGQIKQLHYQVHNFTLTQKVLKLYATLGSTDVAETTGFPICVLRYINHMHVENI